ncbi:Sua5/YciO/YrdC/YwlC family protein [Ignatzschineria sp. RMDPL8A]|uniref:L-threonylcarbamoyladenylate synthase n=1 Tax=Ignatzschineria sp. RMDPL8A TaxID=2999236 RepID=UPI002446769D|nr:Sua5/YciO/YrdC/YwlC family protein [Ignatzschineria sp. RMDPL8A]MDG9729464.1 Sua5/YciO/YrdC/YwlC family protein [Ignatzschineria sp. RMDPL8A]
MMLDLDEAAAALKAGQIIAHPTEGVFGLAADAANEAAVRALLDLKKRPEEKGFIVMADSLTRIKPWLKPLSEDEEAKIMNATEGDYRYTWIVPISEQCPRYLSGQFESLAIRITSHPLAHSLCERFGGAIVSTSANISREAPLKSAEAIVDVFKSDIAGVLAGSVGTLSRSTRIDDLKTGQRIR